MRARQIYPTAPTKTAFPAPSTQCQASSVIAENYYRSSSWRSGYEWRCADDVDRAAEAAGLKAPRGSTPPIVYSWQTTQTARDYISAAKGQNSDRTQPSASERPSTGRQEAMHQQSYGDESQPQTDSLDHFQSQNRSTSPSNHAAPASARSHSDFSQQSSHSLTLASVPISYSSLPGEPGPVSYRLPRAGLTGATHQQPHDVFVHPIHKPESREERGGRKTREFLGLGVPPPITNFHLRGAGALPTHRHTTRTSNVRLLAGLDHSHAQRDELPAHLQAHAHVANLDWSQWSRDVEAKLARSQGTLQVGATRSPTAAAVTRVR